MEVKINKDIRQYSESIFFGLSMRQFIFSILACLVAVALYFILRPYFGIETLSWMCILGATPFAILGFVKYNGMTAEQFLVAWIRSKFLMPSHFVFKADNYYEMKLKPVIENNIKKDFIKNKKEHKEKKNRKKLKNKKHNKTKGREDDKNDENSSSNIQKR